MSPPPTARIAIIGAGCSGLTLAAVLSHLLRTTPLPFTPKITVFERDSARTARDQGGSLDMHGETGQRALKLAGVWDEFLKFGRYEGDSMKIMDKHGNVVMSGPGGPPPGENPGKPNQGEESEIDAHQFDEPDGRPEIDRGVLNSILIDSLPLNTIQWGKSLSSLTALPSSHMLTFTDGTSEEFDLVVGADGAWSRTRKLLTPVGPFYSGISFAETRISGCDSRVPHVGAYVGPGTIMLTAENKGIFAQRNSGERVRVYWAMRVSEEWPDSGSVDFSSIRAARPGLRALFADWDPHALQLLDASDEPTDAPGVIVRPLYMLPLDSFKWEHRPGVTLIGDAAHLMTPFAGEGANMAMIDGAELAQALLSSLLSAGTSPSQADVLQALEKAIREYENRMFPRAEETMRDTFESMEAFMNDDAPQSGVRFFKESIARAMEAMAAAQAAGESK
ncbi:FAD/NADP-binding domain-containing protein [Dacryopinax primogenitus]|uniref:FAD/NADP-binding domain-containing protein n=1 Tax=Dacryopinax primogenitus (strain DJM 731) TaxID=1858805 RepID=M5G2D0_DACPD|nr:FAD/NADP-binding domain-containing protein [Dacryopinax primogenitus]EJU00022.1 FAD/NADP-binding domain-containing protein [Dacryopinax primogenitus]